MPKRTSKMPARKSPDSSTYSGRFAIRLRMLREKAGLTVQELADKVEVPAKSIYNWEAGIREMGQNYYPIMSESLGVKVRTLIPEK